MCYNLPIQPRSSPHARLTMRRDLLLCYWLLLVSFWRHQAVWSTRWRGVTNHVVSCSAVFCIAPHFARAVVTLLGLLVVYCVYLPVWNFLWKGWKSNNEDSQNRWTNDQFSGSWNSRVEYGIENGECAGTSGMTLLRWEERRIRTLPAEHMPVKGYFLYLKCTLIHRKCVPWSISSIYLWRNLQGSSWLED